MKTIILYYLETWTQLPTVMTVNFQTCFPFCPIITVSSSFPFLFIYHKFRPQCYQENRTCGSMCVRVTLTHSAPSADVCITVAVYSNQVRNGCLCCQGNSTLSSQCCQGYSCQEIGLVAFMFFFELLFSYVSFTISL